MVTKYHSVWIFPSLNKSKGGSSTVFRDNIIWFRITEATKWHEYETTTTTKTLSKGWAIIESIPKNAKSATTAPTAIKMPMAAPRKGYLDSIILCLSDSLRHFRDKSKNDSFSSRLADD